MSDFLAGFEEPTNRPAPTGRRLLRQFSREQLDPTDIVSLVLLRVAFADNLQARHEPVPEFWAYHPGAAVSLDTVTAEYPDSEISAMLDEHEITPDDLRFFGTVLGRYHRIIEQASRDQEHTQ